MASHSVEVSLLRSIHGLLLVVVYMPTLVVARSSVGHAGLFLRETLLLGVLVLCTLLWLVKALRLLILESCSVVGRIVVTLHLIGVEVRI